jgi:hypothetical protein
VDARDELGQVLGPGGGLGDLVESGLDELGPAPVGDVRGEDHDPDDLAGLVPMGDLVGPDEPLVPPRRGHLLDHAEARFPRTDDLEVVGVEARGLAGVGFVDRSAFELVHRPAHPVRRRLVEAEDPVLPVLVEDHRGHGVEDEPLLGLLTPERPFGVLALGDVVAEGEAGPAVQVH